MNTEQKEAIIAECKELMSKAGYDETKIEQFCNTVSEIIQEIIDNPDETREIKYKIIKRIDRIEFRLYASGDRIDPLNEGKGAEERRFQNAVNSVLFNPETSISVLYSEGWNYLTVKSPSKIANSKLLNEPMVKAMLLGVVAGILCRLLSAETKSLLLEGIAAPIMSALVSLLMGIMGPVFFLFIILSVSSLGSLEELEKVGKVVVKRFVFISLSVAILTTAVALLFFPVFGKNETSKDITAILSALLGTLPSDFIAPFVKGQIPQIILLGIVFGIALVMLGDNGSTIREALLKIKEWVMGVMMIMMKILPLLPFISTMMIVANGKAAVFIQGWKYIAATYICYLLTLLILFTVVSVRSKRSIRDLGKILKEIAVMAFVTATPAATMQLSYEVSEKEMNIDKSFSDLWLSLSYNLLSPARTISVVLSVFFIADMTGMTVDIAVILIMIIMAVQLSLASSGTVASVTVTLETLKMSSDMVGLFSAFEVFTRNAGAAYDITYSMLEQYDAARETGKINSSEG